MGRSKAPPSNLRRRGFFYFFSRMDMLLDSRVPRLRARAKGFAISLCKPSPPAVMWNILH